MTAPRGRGGQQATARGVVVLVAALLVGLGLLANADDVVGDVGEGRSPSQETTTTTTEASQSTLAPVTSSTTAATGDTRPAAEVKVLVVNATGGKAGVGSSNNSKLSSAGYTTLDPKNGAAVPNTTIYYAEGYQADAEAVKVVLGLTAAPVQPMPAEPPVPEASEANVVVVAGQDYAG